MDRQFPPMMLADMRHPMVKQAWVSDFPIMHPNDCQNCSGAGMLTLQVALAGPFRSPVLTSELNCKSDTLNGNLVWWGVKTTSYECPVCHGVRKLANPTISATKQIDKVADAWEGRKDLQ